MIKTAQKKLFKGFTLIELLIVIAIMGVLAAAVLVAINPAKRQQQARDAGRKSDVGQLASALQAFSTSPGNGAFPGTSGAASTQLATLTGSGDLKRIPTPPSCSGCQADYSFSVNNAAVNNEVAVSVTLEAPNTANAVWCWRSSNGVATEMLIATCLAP